MPPNPPSKACSNLKKKFLGPPLPNPGDVPVSKCYIVCLYSYVSDVYWPDYIQRMDNILVVHERSAQRYAASRENRDIARKLVILGQYRIFKWLKTHGHSTVNMTRILTLEKRGVDVFHMRSKRTKT